MPAGIRRFLSGAADDIRHTCTSKPLTLKNRQLRHVSPVSEEEEREKAACWIESIQVEFSIN